MKFSLFENVKSRRGILCTLDEWMRYCSSQRVTDIFAAIANLAPDDHQSLSNLKKGLPVVTWQAWFEGGRKNSLAHPSGHFMLDIDHMDDPYSLWSTIVARREELGLMLAHKTPSGHGLRLVARCRKEFTCLEDCQRWLAGELGVEHDAACKDWARASYLVPESYVYYMDGRLFSDEPEVVYELTARPADEYTGLPVYRSTGIPDEEEATFKGIPLTDIAHEWLLATGGEPAMGERNTRLHALACELRYITDFREGPLLAAIPSYGLEEQEVRSLVHSACIAPRKKEIPKRLTQVLQKLGAEESDGEDAATDEELLHPVAPLAPEPDVPPLPPLIRQVVQTAPADFIVAVVFCLLPLLGTLASKLRARYLDGHLHSPSFQVCLEAPQATGKSFMNRLAELILRPVLVRDNEARRAEQEYNERIAELKVTGVKVSSKNKDELLGKRPKGIIRYVPATISITKLLMRLDNALGLHLCAVSEEIDTVTKAFKRGFSSYGDLLRVAFDNGRYGQDYASDTSYSGIVKVRYNTLFSGTPKAVSRFYSDTEDGLVSRVLFVALPDQFGKPMPVWHPLEAKELEEVERQVERLDAVSIVGDEVQDDHVMDLEFLNRSLKRWLSEQQAEAVRTDDRARDTFCRRAAVIGFRAGMLAWFLYGEKDTPGVRRNTVLFARWTATQMLNQQLLRFQIDGYNSVNRWEKAFRLLGDEFTRDELQRALDRTGSSSAIKQVVYHWKLLGSIVPVEEGPSPTGNHQSVRFRKVKRL